MTYWQYTDVWGAALPGGLTSAFWGLAEGDVEALGLPR